MIEVFLADFFLEASTIVFNQNFSRDWSSTSIDESKLIKEQ